VNLILLVFDYQLLWIFDSLAALFSFYIIIILLLFYYLVLYNLYFSSANLPQY